MSHARQITMVSMVAMFLGVAPAFADIMFLSSGSTSGGSVAGEATFSFGGGTLTLTVENTTTSITAIAQVLDGLSFTTVGGSNLALTNVSPTGFENCMTGTCTGSPTFDTYKIVKGNPVIDQSNLSSPYLWGFTSPLLAAGNGSYKPGGIVNSSISSADGLPNHEHNDYLMGPVVFTFSYNGTISGVNSPTFSWGTTPETTTSDAGVITGTVVPEPNTIFLLGGALLLFVGSFRRKFHRA